MIGRKSAAEVVDQTPSEPTGEFAKLFEAADMGQGKFKIGSVVSGTVIKLVKDFAIVDVGFKSRLDN